MELIDKDALVAEIEELLDKSEYHEGYDCGFRDGNNYALDALKEKINILEVKDPYEQCVQYDSIKAGIQAHAETYSFNVESELFNQLTKEQQKLWRKEIEQACISGGEVGVELSRDVRYKENLEVKEVDLEKERISECHYRQVVCTMYESKILECKGACSWVVDYPKLKELKAQKGE